MPKINVSAIDLQDIKDQQYHEYDKEYLHLLADLGVLDDMEDWRLYQKMVTKDCENLYDPECDKYFKPY
jgi:hypothetical protein